MPAAYKLIGPLTQLVTLAGLPLKGALPDIENLPVENAGLLIKDNTIHMTGSYEWLKKEIDSLGGEHIPLEGEFVCLPGFVDAHTHTCFAGSRSLDYALRNSGKTYLEIAEAGGGISDTVTATRKASLQQLTASLVKRINRHLAEGVTTIEIKSGYGLTPKEELKMLRAIKSAGAQVAADIVATCLAAHILPKDFTGSHASYLQEMVQEVLPVMIKENLGNRVDAFVEKGAFGAADIHLYFEKAMQLGFQPTVHADQFSTGGSALAVAVSAVSADHLEASTQTEIELIAGSNTIAVALPGASLGLGCAFAPARKLLNAGACLAIASDWNPGSAPMGDLLMQAAVLGTFEKLSNTEVLAAITFRAAQALQLTDRGRLQTGMLADFLLFPAKHYREIFYQQGKLKPAQVWKNGNCVFKSN